MSRSSTPAEAPRNLAPAIADPGSGGVDPGEGADLVDYRLLLDYARFVLHAPGRHGLLAMACFVLVAGSVVAALEVLPWRYEVQARILAQPNPLSLEYNQFDAPTRAAREIILRRDNIVALVKQTSFVARHEAARAPAAKAKAWLMEKLRGRLTPEQRLEDAADAVEERLRVAVPSNDTIDVRFEWSNPELAVDVVQGALQSFLDARRASEVASIGEMIEILEEHASRMDKAVTEQTKKVETLERELLATRRERGIVPRPRVVRDQELAKLEARLAARRRTLASLQEVRDRRLADLQAQLQQQEVVYAEKHPALETTRRSMAALSGRVPQLEALRGEIADIERAISEREARPGERAVRTAVAPSRVDLALEPLDEDPRLEYERHQLWLLVRQHTALLERIDSARVVMDTASAGFKYRYSVVKPPRMPKGHVKPDVPRVLLAGIAGGLLFAVFACVVVDLWRGLVVEPWQIERSLGIPVLAELRPR